MITRRTKIQLAIFVVITLLGVTFVGAKYARLDRIFYDDTYTVVAHFPDSGGVFEGAGVTYRGTTIGTVGEMKLTEAGVDVHLEIDNDWNRIPTDTLAIVANRSAVGEQYVDLQPRVDAGPYLRDSSEIAQQNTDIPIPTSKLIGDLATTVGELDRDALRTVVSELGTAFDDTGEDLGQIIDTTTSFIETADANFDLTTALIRSSNTVLSTQADLAGSIRSFARDLDLFSTTLAGADADLRYVIDNGSSAANTVRRFIEENDVEITDLLNNLRTTSETIVANLDGLEHLLVVYPYAVEGGFTVVAKDPDSGLYDAHFGLVLTPHQLCRKGYEGTNQRNPADGDWADLPEGVGCREVGTKINPRGAQNLLKRAPVVATWEQGTDDFAWVSGVDGRADEGTGGSLSAPTGAASLEWLLLRQSTSTTE